MSEEEQLLAIPSMVAAATQTLTPEEPYQTAL